MRIEELGLSAFVAGTAIGYLIWYWARGGGEVSAPADGAKPPEQQKSGAAETANRELAPGRPRSQAATVIACGFLIVALFVGMAFDAAHPMGPPRFAAFNHWFVLVAVLVLIATLGLLLRSSGRAHRTTESYAGVFRATLVVVFGFVLAMFVVVLIWGPHSFYLSAADRWIAAAPLGALLVGIVFGSVGAEWLNYITGEDRLKTDTMEAQHRRWGVVLLILLFLGVLYPFFPQLLGKISSANVTTPIGGVSFSTQPISTIRQNEGTPALGNEASETRNWPGFDEFKKMSDRDKQYANLFYRDGKGKLAAINRLHDGVDGTSDGANDFAKNVLNPLGTCVNEYFKKFKNRGLIQRRFSEAIISYTKLLHPAKADRVDAKTLLDDLAAAVEALNKDMRSDRELQEQNEPCEDARKSIANANRSLPTTLPYAAMGLAFLLFDSGEAEQAMREIASWVEDHYRNTAQEKLAECNDKKKEIDRASCAYYGYKPDPEKDETTEWERLPPWYSIRIEFELTEMLAPTVNRRVAYFTAHELVHTIESLFTGSEIMSAYDWTNCDSALLKLANRPVRGTQDEESRRRLDEELKSRMVAAYFSLVDKMLRNLTSVADEGLLDGDVAISPEMLTYAAKNSSAPLYCLSYYQDRPDDLKTYDGEYKATYGVLLVQAILQRDPPTSEFERAGRKEAITNANVALRRAIPILKQQITKHDHDLSAKRFDERLFALLEERDYLRRATIALKTLEDMER